MAARKKPTAVADGANELVTITCTADRLHLNDGTMLIRDQSAEVSEQEAAAYVASERATRG